MVASYGQLKPKQVFRFINQACAGYVTGPFLARLQETGKNE